jgi:hypothetical protein
MSASDFVGYPSVDASITAAWPGASALTSSPKSGVLLVKEPAFAMGGGRGIEAQGEEDAARDRSVVRGDRKRNLEARRRAVWTYRLSRLMRRRAEARRARCDAKNDEREGKTEIAHGLRQPMKDGGSIAPKQGAPELGVSRTHRERLNPRRPRVERKRLAGDRSRR